jgi:hypothetical protein
VNKTWCILVAPFVLMEVFSICLFGIGHLGFISPVALLMVPIWAVHEGSYYVALNACLIDAAFLSATVILICKNRKIAAGIILLLFNITSIVLVLNSW